MNNFEVTQVMKQQHPCTYADVLSDANFAVKAMYSINENFDWFCFTDHIIPEEDMETLLVRNSISFLDA